MTPANQRQVAARVLVLVTLSLVAFGLVMVYSATSAAAAIGNGDPMTYLKRQGIYAALGIVLLVAASRFDNRRLWLLAPPLVLVALGLCAAVLVLGPEINGARRWLYLGPASFQPSELAKLALCSSSPRCISLARVHRERSRELWRPLGLLTCAFSGLILLQPDLGTTISLVLMLAGMLVVAGVPARTLAAAGGIAVTIGLAAIWIEPYRRARVLSFLDPWQDAQGAGFQNVQAIIGMGSGGLTGEGLGHGVQKINYLPEAHTDMIFAIVGEELGLVGTTAVIAAFGGLRLRRLHGGAALPQPVRQARRGGSHVARLRPGGGQPRRGDGDRPADRDSAPVRLLRRLEPRDPPRRGRDPP